MTAGCGSGEESEPLENREGSSTAGASSTSKSLVKAAAKELRANDATASEDDDANLTSVGRLTELSGSLLSRGLPEGLLDQPGRIWQQLWNAPKKPSTDVGVSPPFRRRQHIFTPLEEEEKPRTPSQVVSSPHRSVADEDVRLKGFAGLDSPRVVLAVDDRLLVLRAGQSEAGIEVVAIEPPRATLRRGGEQWILSLLPDVEPDVQ